MIIIFQVITRSPFEIFRKANKYVLDDRVKTYANADTHTDLMNEICYATIPQTQAAYTKAKLII
jgi:uncharacterized protein YpmB